MFDEIANTIFPDECQVLEIVPDSHYVFPIYKNGSSSLIGLLPYRNWKSIDRTAIKQIKQPITVYLRSAKERFISGVNTYCQHLQQQNSALDQTTVLWFINRYLFLNRHFCPQFFWLLNLARHADTSLCVKLESLSSLKEITPLESRAGIHPPSKKLLKKLESFDWTRLELYFFLDQILTDRIGQQWLLKDLLGLVKKQYPNQYQAIFGKSLELTRVLSEA